MKKSTLVLTFAIVVGSSAAVAIPSPKKSGSLSTVKKAAVVGGSAYVGYKVGKLAAKFTTASLGNICSFRAWANS